MKASELRDRSDEELKEELLRLAREQFNLRLQRANGQLGQTHLIREARRGVARIKTLLLERQRAAQSQAAKSESND